MLSKNIICVVIDRMHAGMVGAYGNSWIHSDHLDRLACDSILFDQAYCTTPQLEPLYRALWLGVGPSKQQQAQGASLPRLLSNAGWHSALVTDEAHVAELTWSTEFEELIVVDPTPGHLTAANTSQTQLARTFGAASTWLETARQPFCLWLHARGMGGAWDAPLTLRNQFADAEDPTPPTLVEPPNRMLDEDFDPDELLGITHAYAGQVALVDECIATMMAHLQQSGLDTTTQLTFLSARGFPLGEHRRVGGFDETLYNDLTQLVWLMRFPDGLGRLDRSQALVVPADLPGTLLDWLGIDRTRSGSTATTTLMPIVRGECEAIRDWVYLSSLHDRAIRTPAWLLRQPNHGPAELYAKPGDRWEVNEVASLCGEIVEGLQAVLRQAEDPAQTGELAPLGPALSTQLD